MKLRKVLGAAAVVLALAAVPSAAVADQVHHVGRNGLRSGPAVSYTVTHSANWGRITVTVTANPGGTEVQAIGICHYTAYTQEVGDAVYGTGTSTIYCTEGHWAQADVDEGGVNGVFTPIALPHIY